MQGGTKKNHDFRPISRFMSELMQDRAIVTIIIIIIIIIIKNECHSNIIVDRLQGCGHSIGNRNGE